MQYSLLIYFNNKPRHVSSSQQPVNIMHGYINCCLYRVKPPDDEQQACSKHTEAYY